MMRMARKGGGHPLKKSSGPIFRKEAREKSLLRDLCRGRDFSVRVRVYYSMTTISALSDSCTRLISFLHADSVS